MESKIIPNLWFDHQALEAASYYAKLFDNGRIANISYYPTEGLLDFQKEMAGGPLTVEFELAGVPMLAINAGPEFKPNPSMSFMVHFDTATDLLAEENLDALWFALSFEGEILMELGEYPFSPKYGWVRDRYGYSWQLMLTNLEEKPRPRIVPALMFGGVHQNQASEALEYYTGVFAGARQGDVVRYEQPNGPATPGAIQYGEFESLGHWFILMDSGVEQDFTFNESMSFMVNCADQAEIDRLWDALSAVPEAEACGWCKDRFGVSWQIVPDDMERLMSHPGAYQRMMTMKKLVIDQLLGEDTAHLG